MKVYKAFGRLFDKNDRFEVWKFFHNHNNIVEEEDIHLEEIYVDTTQPFFHQLLQVGAKISAVPNGILVELGTHMWVFNQEQDPLPYGRTVKFDYHSSLPVIKL